MKGQELTNEIKPDRPEPIRMDWSLERENGTFVISPDELRGLETVQEVEEMVRRACEEDFASKSAVCVSPDYYMLDQVIQRWKELNT